MLDGLRRGGGLWPTVPGVAGNAARTPVRPLYLDTETTGLSGGAGVLVFVIGVGVPEDDRFVVHQWFLEDPADEADWLEEVFAWLGEGDALVSFHGRSFDVPRLCDRFAFHHAKPPPIPARHLDLLPIARRLFGHRVEDHRLATLETVVLGTPRQDDLPGAECPEAYFRFLRGVPHRVDEVLDHNARDILSLLGLELAATRELCAPSDLTAAFGVAELARRTGQPVLRAHALDAAAVFAKDGTFDAPEASGRRGSRPGTAPFGVRPRPSVVLEGVRNLRRAGESVAAAVVLEALLRVLPGAAACRLLLARVLAVDLARPAEALRHLDLGLAQPSSPKLRDRMLSLRQRIGRTPGGTGSAEVAGAEEVCGPRSGSRLDAPGSPLTDGLGCTKPLRVLTPTTPPWRRGVRRMSSG